MWVKFPDNIPPSSGYYFTRYYNPVEKQQLYKALWFDTKLGVWTGPWRWSYRMGPLEYIGDREYRRIFHTGIDVKMFDANSRTDYYTQCEWTAPE